MRSKGKALVEVDHSVVSKQIGEQIRYLRLQRSFTQQELGLLIGITFQQVQKYETGKNYVSVARLFQICAALDTPFKKIVYDLSKLSGEQNSTKLRQFHLSIM